MADASSAARMICAAITNGADQAEIIKAAVERGCWTDLGDCERKRQQLKAEALSLIDRNNVTIAIAEQALAFIAAQLIALGILVRAIPVIGGPAQAIVRVISGRVNGTLARVVAGRAANEASFRLVSGL